jgi:hypothetical protein
MSHKTPTLPTNTRKGAAFKPAVFLSIGLSKSGVYFSGENPTNDFTKNEETNVGLNWFIKILVYSVLFLARGDIADIIKNRYMLDGLILFVSFLAIHLSLKCTIAGCYVGIDFYLFRLYTNRCTYWEKVPNLGIHDLWWSYGISLIVDGPFKSLPRCITSNFDKLAELISYNMHINAEIRQKFIDYVNMRKQQTFFERMLRSILVIAVVLMIFYMVILTVDRFFVDVGTEN